jgi:hypothetical protein
MFYRIGYRFTDQTKSDEEELKDVRVRHRYHPPDQGVPHGDGRAHHNRRGVVDFEDHLNKKIVFLVFFSILRI